MSKCDNCGLEKELQECKIKDSFGTRYRNLCDSCILELGAKGQVEIKNKKNKNTQPVKAAVEVEKIKDIMITTSPSFEGYKVLSYKGIVFDETITGIGIKTALKGIGDMFASLTGEQMYAVTERINELKSDLIERLKIKAVANGGNAIIGVDFESTITGGNTIMVSANGTAVLIEKVEG